MANVVSLVTLGDLKMEKTTQANSLLTTDETAGILRVEPGWIYTRICRGRLPFAYIKIGKLLRFPAKGVFRFLQHQRVRLMR